MTYVALILARGFRRLSTFPGFGWCLPLAGRLDRWAQSRRWTDPRG